MDISISAELIWTAVGASAASVVGFVVNRYVSRKDKDEEKKEEKKEEAEKERTLEIAKFNNSIIALTIEMKLANQKLEVLPKVVNDLNALHRKVAELNVKVNQ